MKPRHIVKIVDRTRYDTEKSTLIASDVYWDGHNWERRGRNSFLYRTPAGKFFVVHQSLWQGEQDKLVPLTETEAYAMYEALPVHEVPIEVAFPGAEIVDA